MGLVGEGTVIGKKAQDFSLFDHNGETFHLDEVCKKAPVLLIFYPGDFTAVCTKQLCNYQENLPRFQEYGLQLVGVSKNSREDHLKFASQYTLNFRLLTDPKNHIAKLYECRSKFMLGMVSRAVFIINRDRIALYRYVEPTTLTHRNADELLAVVSDLRNAKLI